MMVILHIMKTHLFKYTPKIENFEIKNSDIFHISAQNIVWIHKLVDAIQMGTHNLFFYKENQKRNTQKHKHHQISPSLIFSFKCILSTVFTICIRTDRPDQTV